MAIADPIDERDVLDFGKIALMEVWGGNHSPAVAARTSYRSDANQHTDEQNDKLIRYLMKHNHSTPLEFCGAVFYCVMPIFVARQWVRHRTASINEESLRYVEARREFYIPQLDRMQKQSTSNKQGSSPECIGSPESAATLMRDSNLRAFDTYDQLLDMGLARELARSVLPLSTYTAWYWACDMNNILKFLHLRLDTHAQYEIRVYAEAMAEMLTKQFPTIMDEFMKVTQSPD